MLESFQLQRDFAPDQGSAPSTPGPHWDSRYRLALHADYAPSIPINKQLPLYHWLYVYIFEDIRKLMLIWTVALGEYGFSQW